MKAKESHVPKAVSSAPKAANSSLRVLVAEDDRINAQLLSIALKKEGLVADLAQSGTQALEKWQATRPDIVLVDYQMPDMDGIALILEIRKRESADFPSAPCLIIGLTASTGTEVRSQFTEAGANAYLTKPVSRKEIAQTLASLKK